MSRRQRIERAIKADPAFGRYIIKMADSHLADMQDRRAGQNARQMQHVAFNEMMKARTDKTDEPYMRKGLLRSMIKVARQFRPRLKPLP